MRDSTGADRLPELNQAACAELNQCNQTAYSKNWVQAV